MSSIAINKHQLQRAITQAFDKIFVDFLNNNHTDEKILIATHADFVKSFHRVLNGASEEESLLIKIENSEPHYFSA